MKKPRGHTAVMSDTASADAIACEADPVRRRHLHLGYFPTPPWATRALLEYVIPDAGGFAWEPAAGDGHMAAVLGERFDEVWRSDVHDYGCNHATGSFVGVGLDVVPAPEPRPDWIITNPPFRLAAEFAERGLHEAQCGVALLVRTAWLEAEERYERLFRDSPPAIVAQFVERVPMTVGRWDPEAGTATSYAWVVWRRAEQLPLEIEAPPARWANGGTQLIWIPPGCRCRLEHANDRRRFAGAAANDASADLFEVAG